MLQKRMCTGVYMDSASCLDTSVGTGSTTLNRSGYQLTNQPYKNLFTNSKKHYDRRFYSIAIERIN